MREMIWIDSNGTVPPHVFEEVEKEIGYKLPESYKNMIKNSDGGWPYYSDFEYYSSEKKRLLSNAFGFLAFVYDGDEKLIDTFRNPSEFFTKGLIAFGGTGNGDYICFDYRHDKDNPSIVYWNHECPEEVAVSPLAPSFEEFIDMLEPYEEIS